MSHAMDLESYSLWYYCNNCEDSVQIQMVPGSTEWEDENGNVIARSDQRAICGVCKGMNITLKDIEFTFDFEGDVDV